MAKHKKPKKKVITIIDEKGKKLAFQLKRKVLRGRGRPFEKGNKLGYRIKKGEVLNPGGRPKILLFSEATRAILGADFNERYDPQTVAEALALVLRNKGLAGDRASIAELADRAEGRPRQSIDVMDNRKDPFIALIDSMKQRSIEAGPPDETGEEESTEDEG